MDFKALIQKAWRDESFKHRLLADPKTTIEDELGVPLPPDVEIFIHEQTPTEVHLVLPMKPTTLDTEV